MTIQKKQGDYGEELVAAELKKRGYQIVACKYRKRYGEIDLIAKKESLLAFVEVKLRSSQKIDLGELIITSKQRKIIAAAKAYLMEHKCDKMNFRFDVALVDNSHGVPSITYIADAFHASEN